MPWHSLAKSNKRPASEMASGILPGPVSHHKADPKFRKVGPVFSSQVDQPPVLNRLPGRARKPHEGYPQDPLVPQPPHPLREEEDFDNVTRQLLSDLLREVQKHASLLHTPLEEEDVRDELELWRIEARHSEGERGPVRFIYIDSEGRAHPTKALALTALYEILVPDMSPEAEDRISLLKSPSPPATLSYCNKSPPHRPLKVKVEGNDVPDTSLISGGSISRMNAFYSSRSNYQKVAPKVPLRLGQYVVQDFGKIDTIRPQYHNDTEIWPIGFRCLRVYYSEILQQHVSFQCDILDGGEHGPRFRVIMEFVRSHEPGTYEGRTPLKAWKPALERLAKLEREADERHAERKQKRLNAGRQESHSNKFDPEEQMLRRKIQRLYEEKDELKHALALERVELAAKIRETMPPQPAKRGKAAKQLPPTDFKSFFIPKVLKLIEGMPGAERCSAYEFMEQRGVVIEDDYIPIEPRKLDGGTISVARPEKKILAVPIKTDLERQEREREKEEKEKEKEKVAEEEAVRKRQRETEREAARQQKIMEKEEKRKAREAEKEERKQRMFEEKRRREKNKELEREITKIRKKMEADVHRRRMFTQGLLAAYVDREEAESRLSSDARLLVEDSELDNFEAPLPVMRGRREEHLNATQLAQIVQLWDFVYTFHDSLGLRRVPSLQLLKDVMLTVKKTHEGQLPTRREARYLEVLDLLGVRLVSVLLPDVIRSLGGYSSADEIELLPCNVMTWREITRWSLILAAYQAMNIDRGTQLLQVKQCGTGNNLDSVERKTVLLLKQRALRQRRGYQRSVDCITLRIPAPNPLIMKPSGWQAALEALRFFPETAKDLIDGELTVAIEAAGRSDQADIVGKLGEAKDEIASGSVKKGRDKAIKVLEDYQSQMVRAGAKRSSSISDSGPSKRAFGNSNPKTESADQGMYPVPSKLSTPGTSESVSPDEMKPGMPPRQFSAMSLESSTYSDSFVLGPRRQSLKSDTGTDVSSSRGHSRDSSPDGNGQRHKHLTSPEDGAKMDVDQPQIGGEKHERDDDDDSEAGSEAARVTMADFEDKSDTIKRCFAVLEALMNSDHAKGFLYLPDPIEVADYYTVVAHPIAMVDIARSLADGVYDDSVGMFAADVRRIFANCSVYNHEYSDYQMQADRLSVKFERLLLDWVLDPKAPPLDQCKDKLCNACHDACLVKVRRVECSRCDSCFHRQCLDLGEAPEGDGTWFCEACVREKGPANVDPYMELELVKAIPGVGTVRGEVEKVEYTSAGVIYQIRYPNFLEKVTREELENLVAAQPLDESGLPAEVLQSLHRPKEIDVRAESEAVGYAGWGLGNTWAGAPRPPRKLDPLFSLTAKRAAEEDPEIHSLQIAIRALEQRSFSLDDALICMSSLVNQVGYLGDLRSHMDRNEEELSKILNGEDNGGEINEPKVRKDVLESRPVVPQCHEEEELLKDLGGSKLLFSDDEDSFSEEEEFDTESSVNEEKGEKKAEDKVKGKVAGNGSGKGTRPTSSSDSSDGEEKDSDETSGKKSVKSEDDNEEEEDVWKETEETEDDEGGEDAKPEAEVKPAEEEDEEKRGERRKAEALEEVRHGEGGQEPVIETESDTKAELEAEFREEMIRRRKKSAQNFFIDITRDDVSPRKLF